MDVSFVGSFNLPFPDHVHRFVSSYRSPGHWIRKESQTGLDLALDEAMILLNHVVHISTWPSLTLLRQQTCFFQIAHGANIAAVLIDIDHPWGSDVRSAQDFAEKALGRSSTAGLIQEEIERLAGGMSLDATLRYNSSVEIHPRAFDLDVGLIDSPGVVGLLQIRAATFIQFRRILLNPTLNSCVID